MKIKFIRKFLAIAIAISTVAVMPGLACAMPKKSNVSENKINDDIKAKCMATLEKLLNEYDATAEIRPLENVDFVHSVDCLSSNSKDIFKNFSQEKMTEILRFLHKIAEFDDYLHCQIMHIIQNLSDIRFSKEGIIEILDIFRVCRDSFDIYTIEDIFKVSKNSYIGFEKEVFSKAVDVFLYLAENPSNIDNVFYFINGLMLDNSQFLNCCTPSQISKIIDMFDIFIKNRQTLRADDLILVEQLVASPKLRACLSESILKFKDIVKNLINDKRFLNSKYIDPVVFIAKFVKAGVLTNLEKQQTMKIVDELLKYSENHIKIPISLFERKFNNNERFNNNCQIFEKPGAYDVCAVYSKSVSPRDNEDIVSEAYSYFGSHICLNNLKTDSDNAKRTATIIKNLICCPTFDRSELAVIDILSECAKTDEAKDVVLAAIAHMIYSPRCFIDIKTQMEKIFQILDICSKDNCRKLAVSSIVGELVQLDFFKEPSQNEMLRIFNILTMCAKSNVSKGNVKFSLEKMLLDSNLSSDIVWQMLNLLFKCVTEGSDQGNIVTIIEYLTFSGKFNNFKPNTMPTLFLVDILNECCDWKKTQAVSKIIEKLASSHIIEYSNDCITLINDILKKCSSNIFARKNVANSVKQLLYNRYIHSSSNKNGASKAFLLGDSDEIHRIFEILDNCLIDCYGDVALKVVSSVDLIKKAYNNIQNNNDNCLMGHLIMLLNKCAYNNIAKKDCARFINKLIIDKCFSDDCLSSTLDLLQKCSEYAPAKEDVLVTVQGLVDCGYINPNSISSHKDKIFSLIRSCSECENKEVFNMLHQKLFPNG